MVILRKRFATHSAWQASCLAQGDKLLQGHKILIDFEIPIAYSYENSFLN